MFECPKGGKLRDLEMLIWGGFYHNGGHKTSSQLDERATARADGDVAAAHKRVHLHRAKIAIVLEIRARGRSVGVVSPKHEVDHTGHRI